MIDRSRIRRRRVGVLAGCMALCAAAVAVEPLQLRTVAEGVHVYVGPHEEATPGNLGAVGNAGVVIGSHSVAVIDTGGSPEFGRRLRAGIESLTDLPVAYVILTHAHPDHVFGSTAFADGAVTFAGHHKLERALATRAPFYLEAFQRLVGSAYAVSSSVRSPRSIRVSSDTTSVGDTIRALATRAPFYLEAFQRLVGSAFEGARIVSPTLVVSDETRIDLGDRTLLLTAYRTAHTDNDLTVLDLRTRTLFSGDLVFIDRLPVVDGSLKGWIEVTAALRDVPAERVVPGHGPATASWPDALDAQERYLKALLRDVRREIAAGGRIETAIGRAAVEERDRWTRFDLDHPRNVTASFTELEWE